MSKNRGKTEEREGAVKDMQGRRYEKLEDGSKDKRMRSKKGEETRRVKER